MIPRFRFCIYFNPGLNFHTIKLEFDKISEFEHGIYFVKVFSHDNVITRKLVIE